MWKSLELTLTACAVFAFLGCGSDDSESGSGGSSGSTTGGSSGGGAGGNGGSGGSAAGTGGGAGNGGSAGASGGGSGGSAGASSGGSAGQGAGGTGGQSGSSGSGGGGGLATSAVDDCRHSTTATNYCSGNAKPYYWECDKNPNGTLPAPGCEETSPSRWCCPDPFCTRYIGGDSLCAGVYPSTPDGYICADATPGLENCKSLPTIDHFYCCP